MENGNDSSLKNWNVREENEKNVPDGLVIQPSVDNKMESALMTITNADANFNVVTKIIYGNARSVKRNFDAFETLCLTEKPSFMFLSETRVREEAAQVIDLKIEGYKLEMIETKTGHTGGVAIYVKNGINYSVVSKEKRNENYILNIKVEDIVFEGLISVVYRSPGGKFSDFLHFMEEFCEKKFLNFDGKHNLLVGDINLNVSDDAEKHLNDKNELLNLMKSYNLTQAVKDYTRVAGNSKTIIDHVFTTNGKDLTCKIIGKITDHSNIEITCHNSLVPQWKNDEHFLLENVMNDAHKTFKDSGNLKDGETYKVERYNYEEKCNKSKQLFLNAKILEYSNNPEAMSRLLKNYNSYKERHPDIANMDKLNKSYAEIFINNFNEERSESNVKYIEGLVKVESIFSLSGIERSELTEIAQIFKENMNYDEATKILNDENFANNFLKFVNESISLFPDSLQTVDIKLKPKNAKPLTQDDYEMSFKLPMGATLIEYIVERQLITYIKENNIFMKPQMMLYSAELTYNDLLAKLMEDVDDGKDIVGVSIDLSQAFKNVDRYLMLEKLRKYGFDKKTIEWFKNFMSHRNQRVRNSDFVTTSIKNEHGLPLGSRLSKILFALFINDMSSVFRQSTLNMFESKIFMYVAAKEPNLAYKNISEDLLQLEGWLGKNNIKSNLIKTKSILISIKPGERLTKKIKFYETTINSVNCLEYLSVLIDVKLSFKQHFEGIKTKLCEWLGFLNTNSQHLTTESKLAVYNTLFKSQIRFSVSILLHLQRFVYFKELQKIQDKFMKVLSETIARDRRNVVVPTATDLNKFRDDNDILTVDQIVKFATINLLFAIEYEQSPKSLSERIVKLPVTTNRYKRKKNYEIIVFEKALTKTSLFHEGLKLYNNFVTKYPNNDETNLMDNIKSFVKNQKYFLACLSSN